MEHGRAFARREFDFRLDLRRAALTALAVQVCHRPGLEVLSLGDVGRDRLTAAAAACEGPLLDRIAPAQAALAEDLDPPGDLNATPATRLHLARVLLGRALTELAQ